MVKQIIVMFDVFAGNDLHHSTEEGVLTEQENARSLFFFFFGQILTNDKGKTSSGRQSPPP